MDQIINNNHMQVVLPMYGLSLQIGYMLQMQVTQEALHVSMEIQNKCQKITNLTIDNNLKE